MTDAEFKDLVADLAKQQHEFAKERLELAKRLAEEHAKTEAAQRVFTAE